MRKRNKTRRNRSRKIYGGTDQIDIRQILITQPIVDAIYSINPHADISQFKMSKREHGFPLTRMDRMMQLDKTDFEMLLKENPIELTKALNRNGEPMGTTIDGIRKPLYDIVNGRHRFVRVFSSNPPLGKVEPNVKLLE